MSYAFHVLLYLLFLALLLYVAYYCWELSLAGALFFSVALALLFWSFTMPLFDYQALEKDEILPIHCVTMLIPLISVFLIYFLGIYLALNTTRVC